MGLGPSKLGIMNEGFAGLGSGFFGSLAGFSQDSVEGLCLVFTWSRDVP